MRADLERAGVCSGETRNATHLAGMGSLSALHKARRQSWRSETVLVGAPTEQSFRKGRIRKGQSWRHFMTVEQKE